MRAIFDISKLASDWGSQRHTGIGRSVEHLAVELSQLPECELSLSCMIPTFMQDARKGVHAHPQLSKCSVSSHTFRELLHSSNIRTQRTVKHLPRPLQTALSRGVRKISHLDNKWGLTAHPLNAGDLAQAQIFHSPMHPLPEMKFRNAPKRCLTIYDLIPLRHPEFFQVPNSDYVQTLIRHILDSATKEDWIISPSQATLDDICNYRGQEVERAVIIPLAADPLLFHPHSSQEEMKAIRHKYGINDDKYFLSVCKLEPRKNVAHLVRGFLQMTMQEKLHDVKLVIAGTHAWGIQEIRDVLDSCPHQEYRNQVLLTEHVEDEELAALYSGATAFLYLSIVEGFGLPPLEAMQCGTPVITSNCSSLPEVVGNAGILLPPNEIDGLAQALLSLYNSSTLHQEYCAKSLARAKDFSWQRCAQETFAAYQNTLSEN